MVKRIDLSDISGELEKKLDTTIQVVAREWTAEVKDLTPVDTGRLRNGWRIKFGDLRADIINNLEYAAPVIFGEDLPPSWGDIPRSVPEGFPEPPPGFPDLIGKRLANQRVPEILNALGRQE